MVQMVQDEQQQQQQQEEEGGDDGGIRCVGPCVFASLS